MKKLAIQISPTDAIYIDGIRHAAEISYLAHSRLRTTLTSLALRDLSRKEIDEHTTAAFLDAWAFIDAVDRFRVLWSGFTKGSQRVKPPEELALEEALPEIRKMRNVADHIAANIDFIVSKHGAALGALSWFTVTDPTTRLGWLCQIVPGTLLHHKSEIQKPSGRNFELPTGVVQLTCGGYSVCLCDVLPYIAHKIGRLEEKVATVNAGLPAEQRYADSTTVLKILAVIPTKPTSP